MSTKSWAGQTRYVCATFILLAGMPTKQARAQEKPKEQHPDKKRTEDGALAKNDAKGKDKEKQRKDGNEAAPKRFGGRKLSNDALTRKLNDALDKEDQADLDNLPYGPFRRLVTKVPVGGIDGLGESQKGLGVEEIFLLEDDEKDALEKIRQGYRNELVSRLEQMAEFNRVMAESIKALRLVYEDKANAVLPEKARAEKRKLDALAREYFEAKSKTLEEFEKEAAKVRTAFQAAMAKKEGDNNRTAFQEIFKNLEAFSSKVFLKKNGLLETFWVKMEEAVSMDARENLNLFLDRQRRVADLGAKRKRKRADAMKAGVKKGGPRKGGAGKGDGKPQLPPMEPENEVDF